MLSCPQAVSASLSRVLSRQRQGHQSETQLVPLLFALCSAGQQQGGATCIFQYRFFQLSQAVQPSHSTLPLFALSLEHTGLCMRMRCSLAFMHQVALERPQNPSCGQLPASAPVDEGSSLL